jgi:hypothetical protein
MGGARNGGFDGSRQRLIFNVTFVAEALKWDLPVIDRAGKSDQPRRGLAL